MIPRQYSLVKFTPECPEKKDNYPFDNKWPLLFLGEISNMPGHCIVADKKGKIHYGWHTENFTEIPEDEV